MEEKVMYHTPTEKKLVNTLFDIDGLVYANIMAKRDVRLNIERIEQILSQKGITDNSNITKELCDMLDDLKFVDQTLMTLTDFTLHFSLTFTKLLYYKFIPLLNNFTMQEKCY